MTGAPAGPRKSAPRGGRVFAALGSNVDGAAGVLERALRALEDAGVRVAAAARPVSSPFEDGEGRFVDGVEPVLDTVVELRTDARPRNLLALFQEIEHSAGRDRETKTVRALDLDLLDAGVVVDESDLVLPHPRARERAFVLAPWEEIAPHHLVSGTGESVLKHAARLRGRRPEAFRACRPQPRPALPDLAGEVALLEDGAALARWRETRAGAVVGVVPTMGALHDGHEALLRRARAECDVVLATLFVNPLQFGAGEDLGRYPRTFDADRALLRRAGADAVYAPREHDLYPVGFATYLEPEGPACALEGIRRPGHFRGVATVVYKLWRRVRPDRAYFGLKDAQQLAVIRRMVQDLELEGTVVACPTVRETEGLALSSRNRYLAPAERGRALRLSRALEAMVFEAAAGIRAAEVLKALGLRILREADLDVDYLEIVDAATMTPRGEVGGDVPALAVAAVHVGTTHLLDNRWIVDPSGAGTA